MHMFLNLSTFGMIAVLGAAPMVAEAQRTGTFHAQSIVVAFYRSPLWSETLKQKSAERDAAKKAGDEAKVKELGVWGGASQELAHRQLAGHAPLTNILEALRPAFAEIARNSQASKIVPEPAHADPAVQSVDVTDQLLDWLKADEATRKIVRELRHH